MLLLPRLPSSSTQHLVDRTFEAVESLKCGPPAGTRTHMCLQIQAGVSTHRYRRTHEVTRDLFCAILIALRFSLQGNAVIFHE